MATMDFQGDSQPTQQATQGVIDPRRVGKQNSGFSDEDVSDIICLLYPHSEAARREASRIADECSTHILGRRDADNVGVDLSIEDDASRFQPQNAGEYAIMLRLSAPVRDPEQGFTFGRNLNRCDIIFKNDPHRRLSNIHFRIYVNEYGVVMLEDTSTNGTVVDNQLLKCKGRQGILRRTLSSGSIVSILMHEEASDLSFLVRIPKREGEYDAAYRRNLADYLGRLKPLDVNEAETIRPDMGQGTRAMSPPPNKPPQRRLYQDQGPQKQKANERLPKDWDGSGTYNVSGCIGKGAFATVHMATSKFDGCPYAAKELEKRRFMKNGVLDQKAENEMKIMQSVQHKNIVRYIEHFDWRDRLIIIMEYIPLGDLGHYIMDNGPLPEETVQAMSVQLLGALEHLHSKNITHRDIKPDNILINSDHPFDVKLTDFGLSKMVDNEQTFLTTFCGTLLYCAPEVYGEFIEYDDHGNRDPNRRRQRTAVVGQRYGHAVDIWSLGGVLFYSLTSSAPYPVRSGITYMELLDVVMTTELNVSPLRSQHVSLEGIDCLRGMINKNPSQRATINQLMQHRWHGGAITFGNIEQPLSDDEISDDQLEQSASQLQIAESQPRDSDDEFGSQLIPSLSDLAEQEDQTFGARPQQQRLFGEVGLSALRSSGAIQANRLNLRAGASSDTTMGDEGEGAQVVIADSESENFSTPRQRSERSQPKSAPRSQPMIFSMSQSQQALDNIEPGAESQSLGCADSIIAKLNMKSVIHNTSILTSHDLTSSKRKPLDRSDEDLERSQSEKPFIKRLKSEGHIDTLIENSPEEFGLLALVPQVPSSRRQIETPVHKSTFWNSSDRKSWHLRYPEMVNSQYMAFRSAAQKRGEEFAPGKSPFWELAMKHFPPTNTDHIHNRDDSNDRKSNGRSDSPPTSSGANANSPDAFPPKLTAQQQQTIATVESSPTSEIQAVSVSISSCFLSFGRDTRNTVAYHDLSNRHIPKNALKIVLWRPGFEPNDQRRPWQNSPAPSDGSTVDSLSYAFYISTKATAGITVAGAQLPSHNPKNPADESKHWIKLHHNDVIILWNPDHQDEGLSVSLIFRCSWGGSSLPRPAGPAALVPAETAGLIDLACARAERNAARRKTYDLAMEAANDEMLERRRNVELEVERKNEFERRRQEALKNLELRVSTASLGGGGMGGGSAAIAVPGGRLVPRFGNGSIGMVMGAPPGER